MKIAILHGYSAANAGDGLLVFSTLNLIRSVHPDAQVTLFASYPDSFRDLDCTVISTQPTRRGYRYSYLRALIGIRSFDVVVGVGGGYLRFGTLREATVAALVHGPQLIAAALLARKAVYMPQSVGPMRGGSRSLVRFFVRRLATIMLRDDVSVREVDSPNVVRISDLALLDISPRTTAAAQPTMLDRPVVSVRQSRGSVPESARALAAELSPFDGYVQSEVGSNNDVRAVESIHPDRIVTRSELMGRTPDDPVRVVVAMRLHAALMALQAGHVVIHLSYERKGFGAFQDLGLGDYVHNVFDFDHLAVARQVRDLLSSPKSVRDYQRRLNEGTAANTMRRQTIVDLL